LVAYLDLPFTWNASNLNYFGKKTVLLICRKYHETLKASEQYKTIALSFTEAKEAPHHEVLS
jgi:hypothetical protein